jgi:hypothetical protein
MVFAGVRNVLWVYWAFFGRLAFAVVPKSAPPAYPFLATMTVDPRGFGVG